MVGDIALPYTPIAVAAYRNKPRGSGPRTAGPGYAAREGGPATEANLAGVVARSVHGLAVDTPRPFGPDGADRGECLAPRLKYTYMARGTAVQKCAWSYWPGRSPRSGSGRQA